MSEFNYGEYEEQIGLGTASRKPTLYLQVKHEGLCEEHKIRPTGSRGLEFEKTEVDNPSTGGTVTKYLKHYEFIAGFLDKIEYTDNTYDGTRYEYLKLHFDLIETNVVLAVKFESRASSRIMKLARNIDYTKPVRVEAWKQEKWHAINFIQGGQPVKEFYNKENREEYGCPPWEERNVRGKVVWDNSAELNFLLDDLLQNLSPHVEQIAQARQDEMDKTRIEQEDDGSSVMERVIANKEAQKQTTPPVVEEDTALKQLVKERELAKEEEGRSAVDEADEFLEALVNDQPVNVNAQPQPKATPLPPMPRIEDEEDEEDPDAGTTAEAPSANVRKVMAPTIKKGPPPVAPVRTVTAPDKVEVQERTPSPNSVDDDIPF